MSSKAKSLVKSYKMIEQSPGDVDVSYSQFGAFILGVIHIIIGLFSIALGIASICIHASGYFIGYGIWCGFLVGWVNDG